MNYFMIMTILGVGVLAGLQTLKDQTEAFTDTLDALSWFIQVVFTLDCAIKIAAEGSRPYHYFYDSWNNFDFFIVVTSVIEWVTVMSSGGSQTHPQPTSSSNHIRILHLSPIL